MTVIRTYGAPGPGVRFRGKEFLECEVWPSPRLSPSGDPFLASTAKVLLYEDPAIGVRQRVHPDTVLFLSHSSLPMITRQPVYLQ